ncbi:MAG TPA: OB-fold nucleic acid binding domain-containing protein, partial [Ferruginibacter sp.]|nr:OB-fold nucleic acid binding domain-containing protein [Ferruginibacter sp.]
MSSPSTILSSPIEYLKGVGPLKAELIKKELNIFTFKDLLEFYPFRHVDRTKIDKIASLTPQTDYAQVAGKLIQFDIVGEKRSKRLVAYLEDDTGEIELTWFQGINWIEKNLHIGQQYLVFGKVGFFMRNVQIMHPEIEIFTPEKAGGKKFLEPVYPSTEKLKTRGLNGRAIGKLTHALLQLITAKDLPENLPEAIVKQYRFVSRYDAFCNIHFPASDELYTHALRRLKFEELFFAQIRLGIIRGERHRFSKG